MRLVTFLAPLRLIGYRLLAGSVEIVCLAKNRNLKKRV